MSDENWDTVAIFVIGLFLWLILVVVAQWALH